MGVRLMASSGASCGGGGGAHGDKPPRALGGGQRLWRGCGVWMEVVETMDKELGGPLMEPILSLSPSVS